ncbi:MAG: CRISPR-associated endonuclease Cas2 [Candidatus Aenigmarchaeota archaeon]|jgi:CRISPR-associated protein Cas2|nr:CRISPR-associated endonuclease Cas2 [Candidatus Aenigmarchaeota archaeon]
MYVIVVYDVNVQRVNKVCQFLRMFLHWVQNSVFEGELTESELMRVEMGLKEIINENEDSITIYIFPNEKVLERRFIGIRKNEPTFVL